MNSSRFLPVAYTMMHGLCVALSAIVLMFSAAQAKSLNVETQHGGEGLVFCASMGPDGCLPPPQPCPTMPCPVPTNFSGNPGIPPGPPPPPPPPTPSGPTAGNLPPIILGAGGGTPGSPPPSGPSGGTGGGLGNLSPAAGGNAANLGNLGDLSPSAGGSQIAGLSEGGIGMDMIVCVNNYLLNASDFSRRFRCNTQ